jgi:S-adenosylmethionine:tRNA ribosyltransferase-isomerase
LSDELEENRRSEAVPFLDYQLPVELIAQVPAEPRDSARLLVVERTTGTIADRRFKDLPDLLVPGDLLVLNDTRVIPARLQARRASGGRMELLLTERIGDRRWRALIRPLGRLRPGEILSVDSAEPGGGESIVFIEREEDSGIVELSDERVVQELGEVPLPPYIHEKLRDPERYQTVYAKWEGSAAAPTAGLHFTTDLLDACRERGVEIASTTLHVGVDTFRPIIERRLDDHRMHSEWFSVPEATVRALRRTKLRRGRVVAVGTTVVRVLETIGACPAEPTDVEGRTSLFIRPPFDFKVVDALISNFHLPRTTLLLMVGAFAGSSLLATAYEHAIEDRYRFYSFGDAMLIV